MNYGIRGLHLVVNVKHTLKEWAGLSVNGKRQQRASITVLQ